MAKISEVKKNWKIAVPENANIRAMLSYPPDYYQQRLQKIGFYGQKSKLLDAACGAGHWSIAASFLNAQVYGIDSTENYLNVARRINQKFKRKNLKFTFGKMESLPYPDDFFDYVISYCAWMYTDRPLTLKEMYRVLKPGGRIYLGAVAGWGWYFQLIWQGIREGRRYLIFESLKAIKKRIQVTEKEARRLFERQGLKIINFGPDTSLGNPKILVNPFYQQKFLGLWNVFEILGEKTSLKRKER